MGRQECYQNKVMRWQNYNLLILNLVFDIMKEEGNQQKQMLINRLYKTKNTQNTGKPVMKSDDDTKLLFYQTRKKSFKEKEQEPKLNLLPSLAKKTSLQEDNNVSLISARRTSRGNSFTGANEKSEKQILDMPAPARKPSAKKPQLQPISPTIPKKYAKEANDPIYNTEVATFFKMVRQKKLTADEFIYMIRKHQNDHYNMEVVPYSEIIKNKIEDYYTFSCKGVSKFVSSKPVQFITVQEWFDEVKAFNEICRYNFFITFRKWKSLKKWMKVISTEKIKSISKILEEKMFLTNAMYQKILINHKTLCADMENLSFATFYIRDPVSKEDLLIKRVENSKQFNISLNVFSKKMHENSASGINVILKTLRSKIKKQDSKKEDALGFPQNMNYGDRSMMRYELIRIIRLSYLIEFITTETLGRCYLKNIEQIYNCIETPVIEQGDYQSILKPIKFADPKKTAEKQQAGEGQTKQEKPAATVAVVEKKKVQSKLIEPLFKIKLIFDKNQKIEQEIQQFDEDTQLTLIDFDLNFWDTRKIRRFKNMSKLISTVPKQEELTEIIISYFKQNGIQRGIKNWRNTLDIYIDSLEEWDDVVGGRSRDRENTSEYIDPSLWLKQFPLMLNLVPRIQESMKESYDFINQYINQFSSYLEMFKRQELTSYEDLNKNKYQSLNQMFINLVKLNDAIYNAFVDNLEDIQQISIYEVDTLDFKRQLLQAQEQNMNRLSKFIEKQFEIINNEANDFFEDCIKRLSTPMAGIQDFSYQKDNLQVINKRLPDITDKVNLIMMHNQLLPNMKNPNLRKKIEKTITLSAQGNQLVSQTQSLCQSSIDKYRKQYKDIEKKINKQFEQLITEVQDKKWLTESGKEIISWKPKIEKLEAQVKKLLAFEQVLENTGDGNYDNLYTLKMEFDLRYSLWKGLEDFQVLKQQLEKKRIKQIDVKPTMQTVQKYVRIVNQCERNLSDNQIVPRLKNMVWVIKDSLPALNALKSQYLEPEHVQQISDILNQPFDQNDESLTLGKLLDIKINEKSTELIEVATKALQERQLKETLQQVEKILNETDLFLKPYKEGTYILGQVDELSIILDEALANVNNTLANRYVKAIRSRAEKISAEIQLIMEIVDKWVQAQRKWMYLQNIFVAPDIKTQMPLQSKQFENCDKFIRGHVKKVAVSLKINRLAKTPKLLAQLTETTQSLQKIEKKLEQYLESKRKQFPRFYFLSNEQLLQILSRAGNLEMIEQHLGKCFEALVKLYMADGKPTSESNVIEGICSPEKEKIKLKTAVMAKGNVQKWLKDLQREMYEAVRKLIAVGYEKAHDGTYQNKIQWIKKQPSQVVAVASQIIWTWNTERSIEQSNIEGNQQQIIKQLRQLTLIVRQQIPDILRKVIVALITIEVHNRDIVNDLIKNECQTVHDFLWQQQLRYYLGNDDRTTHKQVTSELEYGYQYLGATSRLVITPLTDRCWITITSALANKLGASPAGPAGTGKTESTKDLAKALGRLCIVFNCSDQITANMMNKLFKGLAQQGAWSCLDEFNRIDIQVLSVIAQQLLIIRMALLRKNNHDPFDFDGDKIPLLPNYGCFITMNPGYAGRTQLPDNLKSLFRPVSMMIPDYAMIAEIMLFAEGFENASVLSKKMVQLYKLSSEQLSQQDHYDFGMRAVKSLLVMAGSLKRAEPELEEDSILIKAMKFANIPKFVKADIPLFTALISDLFPTSQVPPPLVSKLQTILADELKKAKLQPYKPFEQKIIQLYDTFNVRFGVMLVGQSGSGKSCCYKILAQSSTTMKHNNQPGFNVTTYRIMNPKSISMGEMYGEVDPYTQEWADGLASSIIRDVNTVKIDDPEWDANQRFWVVFDGPVDALWIQNMNTVLDDNMTLCLANSQRIKLRPQLRMLFEVQDLSVASPATVSRCGMVYLSFDNLHWSLYVQSWLEKHIQKKEHQDTLFALFNKTLQKAFNLKRKKNLIEPFPTTLIQIATNICSILQSMHATMKLKDDEVVNKVLTYHYIYAMIWGFGGGISYVNNPELIAIIEEVFPDITFPRAESIFDNFINPDTQQSFVNWTTKVPEFVFDKDAQFFDLLVPTIDTIKYSNIIEQMLSIEKPLILTGESGVGKSVLVANLLTDLKQRKKISTIALNFSAQTKAKQVQMAIESKLVKKGKTLFGARTGEKICIFIDDVNMPALEFYGAQPCIELLRQLGDLGGFYDRHKLFFKEIIDTTMVPVCAPPGGGRNQLSFRYLRQLLPLMFPTPNSGTAFKIFNSLLAPKCTFSEPIVLTTLNVFDKICKELLPTPSKFQYIYNMRDIGKVIQNIGKGKQEQIVKLFIHEIRRVFADRMIEEDYVWFRGVVTDAYKRYFSNVSLLTDETFSVLFTDILKLDTGASIYEEVTDRKKLFNLLDGKQQDYKFSTNQNLDLVFFDEAVEQILRICRILKQPRGNAMLIGVGGSGKQSLSKLSSYIMKCQKYQIELVKNYNSEAFRGDLQKITKLTGAEMKKVSFIFTDVQIAYESFLEDINNILNTGQVPNLFVKKEDIDQIYRLVRPHAIKKKIQDSPEPLWNYFINCIRQNLHVVLCMSPVGQQLRVRCRKFPSLINCCSLDWFPNWPKEALIKVANKFIKNIELPDDKIRDGLTEMCMNVSVDVNELCEKYMRQLRRRVYTTPKSYLDHIKLYEVLLATKKQQIESIKRKLSFGLEKLYATNEVVAKLQNQMTILKPQLAQQSIKTEEFLKQLAVDTHEASKVEAVVQEQAELVNAEQQQIKVIADDAQAELSKAIPALNAAAQALKKLNKNDITEIKGFANPPPAVVMVLEGVCILLGEKSDWQGAKKVMMEMGFLDRLKEYDKQALADKDALLKKLRVVTKKPEFDVEQIGKKSVACKSLAMWVKAMDNYARISKEVQPKKKKVAQLTTKLDVKNRQLKIKQDELQKVKDKVSKLQKECDQTMALKKRLEEDMIKTNNRLVSAQKLTVLLEEEGIRWKEQIESIGEQLLKVIGDVFLSAATISYLGPFTGAYREPIIKLWKEKFANLGIPYSENYSLANTLETPLKIRQWILEGLSNDNLSIDNGVIATKCERWPLFIDPQGQAYKWIKKHEENNNLKIINFSETHYLKTVQTAIQSGYTVLLENVEQKLEPAIDSVLQKQIIEEDNRKLIRVGQKKIDYDNKFKLFITTKLSNPNYLPQIYIKVTVINFSITFEGLKDQLLGDVVKYELPEIEQQRDEVVVSISEGKKSLKMAQDNILTLLSESKGMILDNIELIKTLEQSKKDSAIIKKKLEETTAIEQKINESRSSYIPISIRGTVLYFVISDLALIDPMYQFSLTYFKKLFLTAIENSEPSNQLEKRLQNLLDSITRLMYTDICRGLFESHKRIYSFLICTSIRRQRQEIQFKNWNLLIRGSMKPATTPNPDPTFFTPQNWDYLSAVNDTCDQAKGLTENLKNNLAVWKQKIKSSNFVEQVLPAGFENLKTFTKLMIIKGLSPEKIMKQFSNYVTHEMGQFYDEIKTTTIDQMFKTLDYKTPMIFILSTGADPTSSLLKYAQEKGKQLSVISLGQGQGVKAERSIERAKVQGSWVLLTNCHLAKSWMPQLQKIVLNFSENYKGSQNFRLILTSMPADYFPVPVLQNGSKLTLEPPRGLKANLKKSFIQINDEFLKDCDHKNQDWHKLVFSLSFFHAIIQERRKFGPLGFNIRYEFNDSDLSISYATLNMFIKSVGAEDRIPWQAMLYMTGHINYGGRVTDDWDRVCLLSILKKYYNQTVLQKQKYELSSSKIYVVPPYGNHKSYVDYIQGLPNFEDPEVFGMHQNANITYQNQESNKIMETILSIQPRVSNASSGKSPDEIVIEMSQQFMGQVPQLLIESEGNQEHFVTNQEGHMHSLSIVLLQEMAKFNNLIRTVNKTLGQLKKAIQGLAVMSQELDEMYLAFQNNVLPGIWKKVSYASLKPLASWFKDFLERVEFLREWLMMKAPFSYWMSGFYFPQGFLTGVLQTHSRQYKIPIDTLSFKFKVLGIEKDKLTTAPENGVYINGLYLDGARWDVGNQTLVDQVLGKLYFPMPIIHFLPFENYVRKPEHYRCPCYKTSNRAGVLSTTGQSTNFILPVDLPTKMSPDFWTLRGTALLCQLDD